MCIKIPEIGQIIEPLKQLVTCCTKTFKYLHLSIMVLVAHSTYSNTYMSFSFVYWSYLHFEVVACLRLLLPELIQ